MPSQSLEQQALDRVARMYSSFDRRTSQPSSEPKPQEKPPAPDMPAPDAPKKLSGALDFLMKDKEQSLIMLLLVILMKDGSDMNTLLALMYLLI